MSITPELVSRTVNETGWRRSKYRRQDGSTFEVALPAYVEHDANGPTSGWMWNEDHERNMRDLVGTRNP